MLNNLSRTAVIESANHIAWRLWRSWRIAAGVGRF